MKLTDPIPANSTAAALIAAYRAGILAAFLMRDGLLARRADIIRDGTGRGPSDFLARRAWYQLRDEGVIVEPLPHFWRLARAERASQRLDKPVDLQGFRRSAAREACPACGRITP